jgi:hypothetical protein
MAEPLVVVGIARTGTIVGVAELLPGHHRRITGASAVLELPGVATHPPVGGRVVWCGIEP